MHAIFPATLMLLGSAAVPLASQDKAPNPAKQTGTNIVAISEDAANRMTAKVNINSSGPYDFIINTGAERTILSDDIATQLNLASAGQQKLFSIGGTQTVNAVHVSQLAMGSETFRNLKTPLLRADNLGADGMVGLDNLQNRRIIFNFPDKEVSIEGGEVDRSAKYSDREIIVTGYRRQGQLIITDAKLSGIDVSVIIDTGSEITIGNPYLERALRRKSAAETDDNGDILAVTGQKVSADVGTADDFRINRAAFAYIPIAFANAPIFRKLGLRSRPAMLLGMSTLRKFDEVAIDFATRKVYFVYPESAARRLPD